MQKTQEQSLADERLLISLALDADHPLVMTNVRRNVQMKLERDDDKFRWRLEPHIFKHVTIFDREKSQDFVVRNLQGLLVELVALSLSAIKPGVCSDQRTPTPAIRAV